MPLKGTEIRFFGSKNTFYHSVHEIYIYKLDILFLKTLQKVELHTIDKEIQMV